MADCCCPAPAETTPPLCPSCSAHGAAVTIATVKALLASSALARLTPSHFHFCAGPDCGVVYFSDDGQIFVTSDVRVTVWEKQPAGERTVCYCFGENEPDMRREIERDGRTSAVERVRAHIAARRCACDVRNPRGTCCLGDVMAAVKRLGADLPPQR
jgi:hypothetical protein